MTRHLVSDLFILRCPLGRALYHFFPLFPSLDIPFLLLLLSRASTFSVLSWRNEWFIQALGIGFVRWCFWPKCKKKTITFLPCFFSYTSYHIISFLKYRLFVRDSHHISFSLLLSFYVFSCNIINYLVPPTIKHHDEITWHQRLDTPFKPCLP